MGHHHKHHKSCQAKIHCKYTPTELNTDKKIHPAGRGNILQGKVAFCEGLKAFPIGKRQCR
jgi:hypothetical protein